MIAGFVINMKSSWCLGRPESKMCVFYFFSLCRTGIEVMLNARLVDKQSSSVVDEDFRGKVSLKSLAGVHITDCDMMKKVLVPP